MIENISVIGLSKLGLCYASVLQSKGFNVFGYEISEKVISKIKYNSAPFVETGLQNLINQNEILHLCRSEKECIEKTELIVIVLPTPSL